MILVELKARLAIEKEVCTVRGCISESRIENMVCVSVYS